MSHVSTLHRQRLAWADMTVIIPQLKPHIGCAKKRLPEVVEAVAQVFEFELLEGLQAASAGGRLLQPDETMYLVVHGYAEQPLRGPEADEAFRPFWDHGIPVLRRIG